jgi:hypothetical protein
MKIERKGFWAMPALLLMFAGFAGQSSAQSQDAHHHEMVARGDAAMGFNAAKTTHHFILSESGGAIEVSANDPKDAASRDAIQHHLAHIAQRFKAGDFDIPMLVHDQVPPGVPTMKKLKAAITYKYAATDRGARVVISTSNPEALSAVHDYLRFQIEEHRTGDPTEVPPTHSP